MYPIPLTKYQPFVLDPIPLPGVDDPANFMVVATRDRDSPHQRYWAFQRKAHKLRATAQVLRWGHWAVGWVEALVVPVAPKERI
jgi:hypothetical protein